MTIDLSDVTFMIPVKIDSDDRVNNLNIVTAYIREHFDTNIIIAEQGSIGTIPTVLGKSLYNTYMLYEESGGFFYKTRLINLMAKYASTPYVAMYDSDVLFGSDQYLEAVNLLRQKKVDFVYPFNGRCINIPRNQVPRVMETMVFDFVRVKYTNNTKALATGGCVMYNRERFIQGGMMNENFISYGPEDAEQDERFKKLGYRTTRVSKPLWHLEHIKTPVSLDSHPHARQNWQEMKKIRRMNPNQLRQYISTWPWLK